ncbi:hypothetical protein BDZ91DRAFT_819254 [Kalaharituber pfeilii]|nr:hypothetical protein BDZ91DRAFT_819254 [Kalaharituber pfeilii]
MPLTRYLALQVRGAVVIKAEGSGRWGGDAALAVKCGGRELRGRGSLQGWMGGQVGGWLLDAGCWALDESGPRALKRHRPGWPGAATHHIILPATPYKWVLPGAEAASSAGVHAHSEPWAQPSLRPCGCGARGEAESSGSRAHAGGAKGEGDTLSPGVCLLLLLLLPLPAGLALCCGQSCPGSQETGVCVHIARRRPAKQNAVNWKHLQLFSAAACVRCLIRRAWRCAHPTLNRSPVQLHDLT